MPTQEERLTSLEQKTAAHIQEMDENLSTSNRRLETMDKSLLTIKHQLNQFETKFDEHTSLLSQILARLPKAP